MSEAMENELEREVQMFFGPLDTSAVFKREHFKEILSRIAALASSERKEETPREQELEEAFRAATREIVRLTGALTERDALLREALDLAAMPPNFKPVRCPKCPPSQTGGFTMEGPTVRCHQCGHLWTPTDARAERIAEIRRKVKPCD